MEQNYRLAVVTSVRPSDVVDLYMDAGWWEEGWKEDVIPDMVKGSFRFVGLFKGNELVGMGRALSDGVSDAYIQDVVVRTDLRGSGWGQKIVARLVEELQAAGIDWIGLIGAPDTCSFYEKLGFCSMPGFTPMKYQAR